MTHGILCCFFIQGIFISRVSAEGPAARAGVKVGDKLLEVNLCLTLFSPHYLCLVVVCSSAGQLHFVCFSGEWCGPPWGRTPHSCRSVAKLRGHSFYDGATWTYGGTRERHHHHAAEAGRWLLPTGEAQQRHCLQPGANHQRTSAATHHLPDPKWQRAWIQHRRW